MNKLTYSDAVAALASRQKTSVGVSLYSTYVNRPAGRHIAALAYLLRATPNQLTGLSTCFSIVGLAVFWLGWTSLPAAILAYLSLAGGFAVDSADGQLSRLQGKSSRLGEWLDHTSDMAKIIAVHLTVAWLFVYSFAATFQRLIFVPFIFCIVAALIFFGGLLALKLLGTVSRERSRRRRQLSYVALLPADYGILCLVWLLVPFPWVFLSVYSLLGIANILILIYLSRSWAKLLLVRESSSSVDSGRP